MGPGLKHENVSKSPYLNDIPMLTNTKARTDYLLRTPSREEQRNTAEVAATVLELAGDLDASTTTL